MKPVRLLAAALACATTLRAQTTPPLGIRDNTPRVVAFTNATIVVSPAKTIEKATLVVRDGRIEAVGTSLKPPKDAVTIDAAGRTLYPGFVDPYTDCGLASVGDLNPPHTGSTEKSEGTRGGANAWNDAIHAEIDWVSRFVPDAKTAEALLKNGYTVVQSSKLVGIFRGRAFVASLRSGLANELVLEPVPRQNSIRLKSEQVAPASGKPGIAERRAFSGNWASPMLGSPRTSCHAFVTMPERQAGRAAGQWGLSRPKSWCGSPWRSSLTASSRR